MEKLKKCVYLFEVILLSTILGGCSKSEKGKIESILEECYATYQQEYNTAKSIAEQYEINLVVLLDTFGIEYLKEVCDASIYCSDLDGAVIENKADIGKPEGVYSKESIENYILERPEVGSDIELNSCKFSYFYNEEYGILYQICMLNNSILEVSWNGGEIVNVTYY